MPADSKKLLRAVFCEKFFDRSEPDDVNGRNDEDDKHESSYYAPIRPLVVLKEWISVI